MTSKSIDGLNPSSTIPKPKYKCRSCLILTEALIVNGVIIANGVADSDGDVLSKKDIKTINQVLEASKRSKQYLLYYSALF